MTNIALDKNGFTVLRYPKLQPCVRCGSDVKVQYTAGMSEDIRIATGAVFASNCPVWFICCYNCMNNLRVKIKPSTFEAQQKALTRIGKEWNKQWSNDDEVERLVFIELRKKEKDADKG